MRRDDIDLHAVLPAHWEIHDRLCNWARWCSNRGSPSTAPMFRQYRSTEIWAQSRESSLTDPIDGHKLEKAVSALPDKHRDAVRWHYVFYRIPPAKMCRHLGVNRTGLALLVQDARSMLKNRSAT